MKTKILSIIIVLYVFSSTINAQLKVNTTGTVSVGTGSPTSSNFNIGTSAYQCNFFSNANHPSGWGDANKIQVSRTDTKALTVYYNGQTRFYVLGDGTMYSNGIYLGSDVKLKENISEISGALDKVLKLHGVTYMYKQNQDVMIDTSIYNNFEKGNNSFYEHNRKKRMGLIAQEVEIVIPEIVMTMPDSTKAISYVDLIGLLIEAFKSQNAIVNAQSLKIKELEKKIEGTDNKNEKLKSASISAEVSETNNAFLYQNTPNPFNYTTEIKYFIPDGSTKASLYIFNLQGNLIKSESITSFGQGSITISASELQPGMYVYSLLINGYEVDTKRMIITE